MGSIRRSGLVFVILIVSFVSGCGYDADVYWPAGTEATLQDRYAPRVLAAVPTDQRAIVKRRSLAIPNNTPVTIVDDPAYRALSQKPTSSESSKVLVRVRWTEGVDQEIELIVRRQDVTLLPGPKESLSAFLPIAFLILIAIAVTVWSVETLALTRKHQRDVNRDEITIYSSADWTS